MDSVCKTGARKLYLVPSPSLRERYTFRSLRRRSAQGLATCSQHVSPSGEAPGRMPRVISLRHGTHKRKRNERDHSSSFLCLSLLLSAIFKRSARPPPRRPLIRTAFSASRILLKKTGAPQGLLFATTQSVGKQGAFHSKKDSARDMVSL